MNQCDSNKSDINTYCNCVLSSNQNTNDLQIGTREFLKSNCFIDVLRVLDSIHDIHDRSKLSSNSNQKGDTITDNEEKQCEK